MTISESNFSKTTLTPKNFGKQNTPDLAQKIGNALLLIGSLGTVVAILPLPSPTITAIASWVAVAGALGKIITKFFGTTSVTTDFIDHVD
jgi:hypothetical protein